MSHWNWLSWAMGLSTGITLTVFMIAVGLLMWSRMRPE